MGETEHAGVDRPATSAPDPQARRAAARVPPDRWFVYSHDLDLDGPVPSVLASPKTLLTMEPRGESFVATFNAHQGAAQIVIDLHRNLLDVPSYAGSNGEHCSRLVALVEPGVRLQALIGHVSRSTGLQAPFVRSFFIATREERTARPPIGNYRFDNRIQIPLFDHQAPRTGDVISLSRDELVIEKHSYEIDLTPVASGAMEFRMKAPTAGSRTGGLLLPMDPSQSEQHLLLVAYHHLHTLGRHTPPAAAQEATIMPVECHDLWGSPGHPLCTNLFGAYQML